MRQLLIVCILSLIFSISSHAQKRGNDGQNALDTLSVGLKWRSVGPAFTSGRISDFAVNPEDPSEYYIATSSGGVWKTINAGVTYEPIFDNEGSYSIGCVTMDPNNKNVIWVGTGENNNQRSVNYGDGIYKSEDGGQSWQHMGLKESEHIGKIIVHPDNSNVVYVAAIGPLWSKGGDRGLYKTTDGGATWEAVLTVDEHTGVNDVIMDPKDPETLYASTLQRRRHVYTYVGGGPGSGLHKSTDGGQTWKKIQKGLPNVELGRIGLANSATDQDLIYAIVEAAQGESGFFASTNRGASWEKRSGHVTSGNYYQEIVVDPTDDQTIYSMDTWMSVSHDGGRSFNMVGEVTKHVDNHCMWINPENPDHWLVGCDGGIYETWDAASTWDFKENLPVTQFYKVAVDNDKPFYNIYGGTQDNFSIGGPSRVLTQHGITNSDWYITNGGDGFESQVDPENPDIVYAQSQYGHLVRYDRKSGEIVGIQPKERQGEDAYRFNWDAPLVASQHTAGTIYFSANKVFRSTDYGNSWEVISDDLTRQLDRNQLKVFDRVVSIDAVMKNGSTSLYGSIVAFSESPLDPDLLVAGTDDGLIQITENGGSSWRRISGVPGVPANTYVNAVYCSRHDRNVIYAAFNNHKNGDFKPYLYVSKDLGRSWTNISANLPERGSVYSFEEDPVKADLIFAGTEFGAYFSPNKGARWKELGNGLPTICVRDIAIQERENDLVLGTFGRGFYVMDDYSVLRNIGDTPPVGEAVLYPVRTALSWEPSAPLGLPGKAFQGDNYFSAENLGPEALFTYYYRKGYESLTDKRRKMEEARIKEEKDVAYPTYDALKAEREEMEPKLLFVIRDQQGREVKKIHRPVQAGIQRFSWDLRYTLPNPIDLSKPSFYNPWASKDEGSLVDPGDYSVRMFLMQDTDLKPLAGPVSFTVKALDNTVMPAMDRAAKAEFQRDVAQLEADFGTTQSMLSEINEKLRYMKVAITRSEKPMASFNTRILELEEQLRDIGTALYGDGVKRALDIDQPQSLANYVGYLSYEQKYTTSPPTKTHRDVYSRARASLTPLKQQVSKLYNQDIRQLEKDLVAAGAGYTPGRGLKVKQ